MPNFVLRQSGGILEVHATYKVLSVMLHPQSLEERERMMAHVVANSRVGGAKRRRELSKERFLSDAHMNAQQGMIAGYLLLTRLQLHFNGYLSSLSRSIPLVRASLPPWKQPTGGSWPKDQWLHSWPRGRAKVLHTWSQFRCVAHLWAASIHIGQHHPALELWRWGEDLPKFLALAQTFLDMACCVRSPGGHSTILNRPEAWNFVLQQRPTQRLEALPLHDQQLAVLQRLPAR